MPQGKLLIGSPGRLFISCLFAVSGVLACTLPVSAQDTVEKEGEIEEIEEKTNRPVRKGRIGWHFIGSGLVWLFQNILVYEDVTLPEDDDPPIFLYHFNVRYDAYEISIARGFDDNEILRRFEARYNHFLNKNIYVFGGFIIWRYKKKYNFTNSVCLTSREPPSYYGDKGACRGGAEIEEPILTGRPDGKNTIPGATVGMGIEYKLGFLALTHEFEAYISACSYDNFICKGVDFKYLGIHLSF